MSTIVNVVNNCFSSGLFITGLLLLLLLLSFILIFFCRLNANTKIKSDLFISVQSVSRHGEEKKKLHTHDSIFGHRMAQYIGPRDCVSLVIDMNCI